jgi:hypothetical protein
MAIHVTHPVMFLFCHKLYKFTATTLLHAEHYIFYIFIVFDITSSSLHLGTTDGTSFIVSISESLFYFFF